MDSTATWPPHDTDYIPTGAYSAGYKGPYDNDYDWPDDTQVPTRFPLSISLFSLSLSSLCVACDVYALLGCCVRPSGICCLCRPLMNLVHLVTAFKWPGDAQRRVGQVRGCGLRHERRQLLKHSVIEIICFQQS